MQLETALNNTPTLSDDGKNLLAIIADIRHQCKDFLAYEPSIIYRGINTKDHMGKKIVRPNRIPRDTSPVAHDILNDIFEEIFGYRLRQESLFGTRSFSMIEEYSKKGIGAMIFPIGEYHIITSNRVTDLYSTVIDKSVSKVFPKEFDKIALLHRFRKLTDDIALDLWASKCVHMGVDDVLQYPNANVTGAENIKVMQAFKDYLIELLKKYIYKHYNFEETTTNEKSELMILCDSYYFIDLDYWYGPTEGELYKLSRYSPKKALDLIEKYINKGGKL